MRGRGCEWHGGMCGRWGCVAGGGHGWQGGVHGRGHVWQGWGSVWQGWGSVAGGHAWQGGMCGGGVHGRGVWQGGMHGRDRMHAWQGGMHATHAPSADTTRFSDTVNERTLRILLECILVTACDHDHGLLNSVRLKKEKIRIDQLVTPIL